MISKEAIKQFLERDLNNHLWIKKCTKEELDEAISSLEKKIQLKHELFIHQKASAYIGACESNFLYFLDMGGGKTIISLWLIEFYKRLKKIGRALVIVPNVINIQGWEEEVRNHTNLTTTLLYGSKDEREFLLESDSDIYVINYDGLQTLMADFAPSTKKRGKKERVINKTKAYNFADLFDFVVFDEIHKTKNHRSLTFQLCNIIASSCKYRYGLTGTPFGRDPHDLWTQFYLVDRGETLGQTLSLFRSAFFTQKRNHWGGYDYKFDKSKEDLLNKTLQNKSIRYEDKEFADLPPTVHTVVPLRLSSDALEYYRETVLESMNNAMEDRLARENYYVKWREICSGFIYVKDQETQEKHELTFSHTEKLDALEEILDDIPKDSRLIIFHIFNKSGEIICDFLTKKKIKFAAINSTSEEDAVTSYKKYQTDSKIKILVANLASGSTGLNLQSANYVIFWEPTDRPIWQKQAEKRVHRHGQTKRVYYYHFITKYTVEEKIRQFLIEGKNLFDALITGKISTKEASGLPTK
jgi:SNF2 family DNA or RNA helicase